MVPFSTIVWPLIWDLSPSFGTPCYIYPNWGSSNLITVKSYKNRTLQGPSWGYERLLDNLRLFQPLKFGEQCLLSLPHGHIYCACISKIYSAKLYQLVKLYTYRPTAWTRGVEVTSLTSDWWWTDGRSAISCIELIVYLITSSSCTELHCVY